MKIDFYISSLSGGGAEKVLLSLARAFAEDGNEVSVTSLEKRKQFYPVDPRIAVYRIVAKRRGIAGSVEDYLSILRRMRESRADVVISFLARCNMLVLVAGLFLRQKIIVSDRNNPLKEHSRPFFLIQNLLYHRADAVVVQTCQIRRYYWKQLQKSIHVIENPLDIEGLLATAPPRDQRERLVVSMGRLEPQKDFETLIEAFSRIHGRHKDWKLCIWGCGEREALLRENIKKRGMDGSVILCGRTDKPFFELSRASIFVLSSFYEGFPNVLCEAMLAGDLCIASDCVSGPRELIRDGKNGWLFPVGDADRLAALLEMCMDEESNLENVRKQAQEQVQRLDIKYVKKKWKELILAETKRGSHCDWS